jgi:glycine cleavage system aminomethyltransferase T
VRRRLVSFTADDPELMMWGGELLLRDGVPAGQVTSAAFGATVGRCVGLAYARRPDGGVIVAADVQADRYQVDVGGTICPITLHRRAPYDAAGARIRGA